MKHLVIGSGNMGTRHGAILEKLGQEVTYVDIGFNLKNGYKIYDSVLVCTPAETHADLINKIPPNIPVFCEKPLLVNLKQKIYPRTASTLMACNWTWCRCAKKEIILFYDSKDKYRYLDIIHFFISHPDGQLVKKKNAIELYDRDFYVHIGFHKNTSLSYTFGYRFHTKVYCTMFLEQMVHWLRVLEGKEKSRLPLDEAEKYNRKLLKELK